MCHRESPSSCQTGHVYADDGAVSDLLYGSESLKVDGGPFHCWTRQSHPNIICVSREVRRGSGVTRPSAVGCSPTRSPFLSYRRPDRNRSRGSAPLRRASGYSGAIIRCSDTLTSRATVRSANSRPDLAIDNGTGKNHARLRSGRTVFPSGYDQSIYGRRSAKTRSRQNRCRRLRPARIAW